MLNRKRHRKLTTFSPYPDPQPVSISLASIGVEAVGDQIDLLEAMQVLLSSWAAEQTQRGQQSVLAGFIFSFVFPNFQQVLHLNFHRIVYPVPCHLSYCRLLLP